MAQSDFEDDHENGCTPLSRARERNAAVVQLLLAQGIKGYKHVISSNHVGIDLYYIDY
jgi:hypothetical protein